MGRKGGSGMGGGGGPSEQLQIDTSNLSGVQQRALEYYQENGEWPKGLSSYQRQKLQDMVDQAGGMPQASDYKEKISELEARK